MGIFLYPALLRVSPAADSPRSLISECVLDAGSLRRIDVCGQFLTGHSPFYDSRRGATSIPEFPSLRLA